MYAIIYSLRPLRTTVAEYIFSNKQLKTYLDHSNPMERDEGIEQPPYFVLDGANLIYDYGIVPVFYIIKQLQKFSETISQPISVEVVLRPSTKGLKEHFSELSDFCRVIPIHPREGDEVDDYVAAVLASANNGYYVSNDRKMHTHFGKDDLWRDRFMIGWRVSGKKGRSQKFGGRRWKLVFPRDDPLGASYRELLKNGDLDVELEEWDSMLEILKVMKKKRKLRKQARKELRAKKEAEAEGDGETDAEGKTREEEGAIHNDGIEPKNWLIKGAKELEERLEDLRSHQNWDNERVANNSGISEPLSDWVETVKRGAADIANKTVFFKKNERMDDLKKFTVKVDFPNLKISIISDEKIIGKVIGRRGETIQSINEQINIKFGTEKNVWGTKAISESNYHKSMRHYCPVCNDVFPTQKELNLHILFYRHACIICEECDKVIQISGGKEVRFRKKLAKIDMHKKITGHDSFSGSLYTSREMTLPIGRDMVALRKLTGEQKKE